MASNSSLKQMLASISPQNLLDQKVSDAHLAEIAKKLVYWKSVCTDLGFSQAEEVEIEEDNKTTSTRRYVGLLSSGVLLLKSFLCESS